jgi:hypothetical protein
MRLDQSEKTPVPPSEGTFVIVQSTHLAAFMATADCKLVTIKKGPERTNLNTPVTKWVYQGGDKAEEIMMRWARPNKESRDWDHLTNEEKDIVINHLTAFSDNLRHFLTEAKKDVP